ncbi:hypothetical protein ACRWOO_25290 [Streptomyces sp. NEAU-PBA10]|uniref:hypothetical protein n=1 Tax=Streptomyces TaxID=1883 RepID=UPI0021B0FE23|nr:hypothetical protein [Streptomyces albidoflavus]
MIIATVAQRKLVRVAALRKPRSATTTAAAAAAARVPRTAPAFKAMENSSEELRS